MALRVAPECRRSRKEDNVHQTKKDKEAHPKRDQKGPKGTGMSNQGVEIQLARMEQLQAHTRISNSERYKQSRPEFHARLRARSKLTPIASVHAWAVRLLLARVENAQNTLDA